MSVFLTCGRSKANRDEKLNQFSTFIEHIPIFIAITGPNGAVLRLNKVAREWTCLGDDQPGDWILPERVMKKLQWAKEHGLWRGEQENFLAETPGAEPRRSVTQTIVPIKDSADQVEFYMTIAVDQTKEKQLERQRELMLSVIQETPDFVSVAEPDGQIIYCNRAAREMLGIPLDEDLSSLHVGDIRPEWSLQLLLDEALPTAAKEGQWRGETVMTHRDGHIIPVMQVIVAHKDNQGEVEYYSTIVRDFTERKRMELRLQHQATHDPLTGVVNRLRFNEHLQAQLSLAIQTEVPGTVLMMDLDEFKQINDTLGHLIGDEVLRHFVRIVQNNLRKGDVFGRLGGDEFAVLLPETAPDKAEAIGWRLLKQMSTDAAQIGDHVLPIRSSIGLAVFPDDGTNVSDVLAKADRAMYVAKHRGGHNVYRSGQAD